MPQGCAQDLSTNPVFPEERGFDFLSSLLWSGLVLLKWPPGRHWWTVDEVVDVKRGGEGSRSTSPFWPGLGRGRGVDRECEPICNSVHGGDV